MSSPSLKPWQVVAIAGGTGSLVAVIAVAILRVDSNALGSLAAWVGAVGTVAAFFATYSLLRLEADRRREDHKRYVDELARQAEERELRVSIEYRRGEPRQMTVVVKNASVAMPAFVRAMGAGLPTGPTMSLGRPPAGMGGLTANGGHYEENFYKGDFDLLLVGGLDIGEIRFFAELTVGGNVWGDELPDYIIEHIK